MKEEKIKEYINQIGNILYPLISYILPTTSANLLNLKFNKFLVGNSPKVMISLGFKIFIYPIKN